MAGPVPASTFTVTSPADQSGQLAGPAGATAASAQPCSVGSQQGQVYAEWPAPVHLLIERVPAGISAEKTPSRAAPAELHSCGRVDSRRRRVIHSPSALPAGRYGVEPERRILDSRQPAAGGRGAANWTPQPLEKCAMIEMAAVIRSLHVHLVV